MPGGTHPVCQPCLFSSTSRPCLHSSYYSLRNVAPLQPCSVCHSSTYQRCGTPGSHLALLRSTLPVDRGTECHKTHCLWHALLFLYLEECSRTKQSGFPALHPSGTWRNGGGPWEGWGALHHRHRHPQAQCPRICPLCSSRSTTDSTSPAAAELIFRDRTCGLFIEAGKSIADYVFWIRAV